MNPSSPLPGASRGLSLILALPLAATTLLLAPAGAQVTSQENIETLESFQIFSSAQASAVELKQESDRIGAFVGADAIGQLPDDTVGDALNRLAGVNVVGGSEVSIRGLEGKLNSIQLDGNGMTLANTDLGTSRGSDTRNFDVSTIPAEAISGIEVIKTLSADLDADSVGGLVNLKTANAFDLDGRLLTYKFEYRHRDNGDEPGLGAYLSYADVLNSAGSVGVMLNFAYRNESYREWRVEYRQTTPPFDASGNPNHPVLVEFDPRDRTVDSTTYTLTGSLDWKLSESTNLYFKPYYNLRNREEYRYRLRFRRLDTTRRNSSIPEFLDSPTNNQRQGDEFQVVRRLEWRPDREEEALRLVLGGETSFERGQLDYSVSYGDSENTSEEMRYSFDTNSSSLRRGWRFIYDNTNRRLPFVEAFQLTGDRGTPLSPRVDRFTSDAGRNVTRLDNVRFQDFNFQDEELIGRLDYTVPLESDTPIELKFGGKYRDRDRANRVQLQDWRPDYAQFPGGNVSELTFKNDLLDEPFAPFNGFYSYTGPFVELQPVLDFFESTPRTQWVRTDADEYMTQASKLYDAGEKIYSLYGMANVEVGKWTVIGGLRYENTETDYVWKASELAPPNPSLPTLPDTAGDKSYDNWFPSIITVYREGGHVWRAAWTNTIARPDFEDLVPFDTSVILDTWGTDYIGIDTSVPFEQGNPNLVAQTAMNWDLAYEFYWGKGNNIAVNFFYKNLDDFLFLAGVNRTVMVPDDPLDPNSPQVPQTVTVDFTANGSKQEVQGVELSWVQDLAYGFGFVANYTYIQGEETIPIFDPNTLQQISEATSDFLSNQPENILNFQAFWEGRNLNLRVAYNQVDSFKKQIFDVNYETFEDSHQTVDASVQYRLPFTADMRLFLDVTNIFQDDAAYTYQGFEDFPENTTEGDRRWVFGLRGTF